MKFSNNPQGTTKNRMIGVLLVLLLLLQLGTLFYYGNRKSGFHEDEFYSYYSTNKTAGLFVEDRTWQERDEFRNDFVVLENEQFRYDVVKQMQSWDVHPPFYYYILHTVCSFFPGVFSKWLGIAVNIIAYIPCYFLLFYLVKTTMTAEIEKEEKEKAEKENRHAAFFAFAVCLFWGFSAAVISGVMFIRMYQFLTLFILALSCLHAKAWKEEKFGLSFYLPLGLIVFLGFLTQYYYIIFHVFLGAGFCFLFLKAKKIKEMFLYVLSCAIGLGAALLYYPSSLSHIFRGYRGTEAVSEFSNADNTLDRLRFFAGLFDDYVLNDTLVIFLLVICLGWLTVYALRKIGRLPAAEKGGKKTQLLGVWLFVSMGYFFTISKTALLLGETSNRYQLPVYGILLFLLLYYTIEPVKLLFKGLQKRREIVTAVVLIAIFLIDVTALMQNKVFFLYEEEKEMMEYVKENKDVPVVVFYREDSSANVWRLSDQLMVYPRIYLASQDNEEKITDSTIADSARLLVYVADKDDKEKCLENLLAGNKKLSSYEEVARKGLWTLYEMH